MEMKIIVKYVTRFYKVGYAFPCYKHFASEEEMNKWYGEMKREYGGNFQIWNTCVQPARFDIPASAARGVEAYTEGSTDAEILGMRY